MEWFDNIRLDEVLRTFNKSKDGRIPSSVLLNKDGAPEDWIRAIEFLTEEGYLKESDGYFEITYRGKAVLNEGGFVRKNRRERTLFNYTITAAICSVLTLIVTLIALLCQICR